VVPGIPHYVIQEGNRRISPFRCDKDYQLYLDLMVE